MQNKNKDIELRSEEVQEILSAAPNWIVRFGSGIFLGVILLFLFLSWFMKYPDVIECEALVTTIISPEKQYANVTGKIDSIYVINNQQIDENATLAIIENPANAEHVYFLKAILDTLRLKKDVINFPIDEIPALNLGEIQSSYATFETAYLDYQINKSEQFSDKNAKSTKTLKETKLLKVALQSLLQLKQNITDWEYNYVLKSKIKGEVSFNGYWGKHQIVRVGDLVFTIIPAQNSDFIAQLKTPVQNSGKIKIDQKVHLKLANYPETEFGTLEGSVGEISITPNKEGFYLVRVDLPKELITSYNKKIEFKHELQASAEIITEDLRLSDRFFYQFKSILNK
mgnify:CR=1 FL=1